MADNTSPQAPKGGNDADKQDAPPGWAKGLRQLYDSVVEEPLPDDFQHLLDKLDSDDS